MTSEEVARIAAAFATANGHSEPGEYAAKVVEAWNESAPKRREADTAQSIADVRKEEAAKREEK